ncbi:MAG TPA: hypothetical protein VF610_11940 [Segetibacter sp.]
MKPDVDIVIVIPVGPDPNMDFVLDTLNSIEYYIHCTYKIIIIDNTHNSAFAVDLREHYPEVVLLKTDRHYEKKLDLYVSEAHAYRYALENFTFRAVLRMDTDVLIIGHHPEAAALELFRNNPEIGLAGRHIRGRFAVDDFGDVFSNDMGRGRMIQIAKLFSKNFMRYPIRNWEIRKLLFKAIDNGYEMGDQLFGGACIFSYNGLNTLRKSGLLPLESVRKASKDNKTSFIKQHEDDNFFSMLICSLGLELGDLNSGNCPFACTWKGLPASPETLYNSGKKIIHSTREWKDLKEEDIRRYFRNKRVEAFAEMA